MISAHVVPSTVGGAVVVGTSDSAPQLSVAPQDTFIVEVKAPNRYQLHHLVSIERLEAGGGELTVSWGDASLVIPLVDPRVADM